MDKLSPAERQRIEEIAQRALKATEGSWDAYPHQHGSSGCRCLAHYDEPTGWLLEAPDAKDCDEVAAERNYEGKRNGYGRDFTGCDMGPLLRYEDADFATHAFTDIPFLLDLVKRMSA